MAVSVSGVTAALSDPQRRLLNLLYDYNEGRGCTADLAMQVADCNRTAVTEALAATLIRVTNAFHVELTGLPVRNSLLASTHLRLTTNGRSWVRLNPENKLIRTVDGYKRGTCRLFDADRVVAADRGRIISLVDDGWATLHFAGDLKETKFSTPTGVEEFRHPKDYVLIPTAKVKTVLPVDGAGDG